MWLKHAWTLSKCLEFYLLSLPLLILNTCVAPRNGLFTLRCWSKWLRWMRRNPTILIADFLCWSDTHLMWASDRCVFLCPVSCRILWSLYEYLMFVLTLPFNDYSPWKYQFAPEKRLYPQKESRQISLPTNTFSGLLLLVSRSVHLGFRAFFNRWKFVKAPSWCAIFLVACKQKKLYICTYILYPRNLKYMHSYTAIFRRSPYSHHFKKIT